MARQRSRWLAVALTAVLVTAAAGCAEESGATVSTPPIPTNPPATTPDPTTATTTATTTTTVVDTTSATTVVDTTTSTSMPVTSSTFLPPAALPLDPADPNNQRTITPDQQPIIDAYLAVIEADVLTSTVWPLDPRSPLLLAAPLTARLLEQENVGLTDRTKRNQILDISGGATFRPHVVETAETDRVFVYDCQIDATFWKDKNTGEKAPPNAWPNAGPRPEWSGGSVQ